MEFHTPKAYSRHAGGGDAHMSRSSRSRGHVASLSCSSIDDVTPLPLSLTPQQNETGDDTLAIAPENAVEPTHSKIQGFSSWNFLPRRVRYVPSYTNQCDQSINTTVFLKAFLLSQGCPLLPSVRSRRQCLVVYLGAGEVNPSRNSSH